MTTGVFSHIDYRLVNLNREGRQRRNIDVEDLAEDIKRIGLINPPLVRREGLRLVAGERRITACLLLGEAGVGDWPHGPVQWAEDLPEVDLQIIELQENLVRQDLCWQDLVAARAKVHELFLSKDSDWTIGETSAALGLKRSQMFSSLAVARVLDDPDIRDADTMQQAVNTLARRRQREGAKELEEVFLAGAELFAPPKKPTVELPPGEWFPEGEDPDPFQALPVAPLHVAQPSGQFVERELRQEEALPEIFLPEESILCANFLEWAPQYSGKPFNFIHCDFPYGIGLFDGTQANAKQNGQYDDNPETYHRLVACLVDNWDRLASISCHLMFWFSERHKAWTLEQLGRCKDLVITPYPLVWLKSDNSGIASDTRRSPRHIYETALFGHTAGRNIVKVKADAYAAPSPPKSQHASAKSEPMLRHFFTMVIEGETRMLDPTCGSGGAIRVAEDMGVGSALGLEIDPEMAKRAQDYVRRSRLLRGVQGL